MNYKKIAFESFLTGLLLLLWF